MHKVLIAFLVVCCAATSSDPEGPAHYQVKFIISQGSEPAAEVLVDVARQDAPFGADRFFRLVKEGFLDGCSFFRVVRNFVVQFGLSPDPKRNQGWPSITDDCVKKECTKLSNAKGTLAFASSGANSRTTQLFFNLNDNEFLNNGFSAFGTVVSGMDAVERIFADYAERPNQGTLRQRGQEYLDEEFPDLDKIITAEIVHAITEGVLAEALETQVKMSQQEFLSQQSNMVWVICGGGLVLLVAGGWIIKNKKSDGFQRIQGYLG